jgi:hypothetical protein
MLGKVEQQVNAEAEAGSVVAQFQTEPLPTTAGYCMAAQKCYTLAFRNSCGSGEAGG